MKMKSIAALLLSALAISLSAPLLADDAASSGSSDTETIQNADENGNGNNANNGSSDQSGEEGNTQDKGAGDDDY